MQVFGQTVSPFRGGFSVDQTMIKNNNIKFHNSSQYPVSNDKDTDDHGQQYDYKFNITSVIIIPMRRWSDYYDKRALSKRDSTRPQFQRSGQYTSSATNELPVLLRNTKMHECKDLIFNIWHKNLVLSKSKLIHIFTRLRVGAKGGLQINSLCMVL